MGAPWPQIGYTGLNAFIILSIALSTRSSMRHPLREFMARRVSRILIPWLVWSGFYLALRALLEGPANALTLSDPLSLLIGPVIHLWFLPFLMLSAPLAYLATHLPHGRKFGVLVLLVGVPLVCELYFVERAGVLPPPLAQWAFALPAVIYGVFRASGRSLGPIAFIAGVLGGMYALGMVEPAVHLALAAGLFELALRLRVSWTWAKPLGDAAFGIYLLHPFCVYIVARIYDYEAERLKLTLGVFILSFAISMALSAGMPHITSWIAKRIKRSKTRQTASDR